MCRGGFGACAVPPRAVLTTTGMLLVVSLPLLSAGRPNSSDTALLPQLPGSGARPTTIAITGTRFERLRQGGTLLEVESTKDLGAVFLGVLDELRHRYLVGYSPRGVSKDGCHRIEVRVKGRKATVKARPGYMAGL